MKDRGFRSTPGGLALQLAQGVLREPGAGPLRVLDPACGDGALLEAAWRVGQPLGLSAEHLFGLEIEEELAQRTRARLRALIGGAAGERAAGNVRTTDALDGSLQWPGATRIVANPPWVSFSGRHSRRAPGQQRDSGRGWPSLHGAFLERIARHLVEESTSAGVLLPAAVCDGEAYGVLRRTVTATTELGEAPLELGEDAFPGVVEPCVLIRLIPRAGTHDGSAEAWALGTRDPILERLVAHPHLPRESFGDPGVHSGNAAKELIVRSGRPHLPAVREGRDLRAFCLGPARLRLDVDLERTPERRFRVGSLERYQAVPILLRQTADRPIAALHVEPTYFRNTLLACTPPAGLDPRFVVAVLNSKVLGRWHRSSFRDARQRTFPQVKVAHLRALPMPMLHRTEAPALHDRVVRCVGAGAYQDADDLVTEAYGLGDLRTAEDAGLGRLA